MKVPSHYTIKALTLHFHDKSTKIISASPVYQILSVIYCIGIIPEHQGYSPWTYMVTEPPQGKEENRNLQQLWTGWPPPGCLHSTLRLQVLTSDGAVCGGAFTGMFLIFHVRVTRNILYLTHSCGLIGYGEIGYLLFRSLCMGASPVSDQRACCSGMGNEEGFWEWMVTLTGWCPMPK